ncbi:epoxide hydrolase family protein [Noviherbaspirillum sedimenti]|uniref:Epoxide hydrolase n=1 Tax=Noviherbaspirillum sedimenti TaxID=2320865 RepID=A0A3A3G4S0_9BURK|nr:epoxide hydrolase family protein [Noviherbaspirillum sedimenti]RJG03487.1 epoxide hydrolase [Noviherbaspirillum sedimenti]
MSLIEPFSVNVPDAVLADLKERLARTRFPDDPGNDGWRYGTNGAYLKQLRDYWLNDYDWRAREREINEFAHFKTTIDGNPLHFIHERGKGPNPTPIILNHGWPWTFWDMRKLIKPLTDPVAFGGKPEDSFDVIVPSLPGFGFSTPLANTGINFWRTADLWAKLMTRLGYDRFASFGSDWGAFVTTQLGHKYADRMIGIHLTLALPLNVFMAPLPGPELYGPGEEDWHARTARFFQAQSGYSAIQATQPQTLAYGLNDSPMAQCAWILEKRRAWSDCEGNVENVFSRDDLLTTMMIYWVTQSGGSSARFYYEHVHHPWQPSHVRERVVDAPTSISIFDRDITLLPRKWAESYYNLKRWTTHPRGGHFAAAEQPAIVIDELRSAFRKAA